MTHSVPGKRPTPRRRTIPKDPQALTQDVAKRFRVELEKAAKEIPEVDPRLPTAVTQGFYIHAFRDADKAPYPEPTDRNGKWLVFVPKDQVDAVLEKIAAAVREGRLGDHAKVSTARPNRLSSEPDRHVICVYTYDSDDKSDVDRIRDELRRLGITNRIPYKTDVATYQGRYRVAGSTRISKYYE